MPVQHEESMAAWVFRKPRTVDVTRVPLPAIRDPDEILLKTLCCAICFTDKHYYEGIWDLPADTIIGHEASAEILAVGSAVTSLEVGQQVVVDPLHFCGECALCRSGMHTNCQAVPGLPFRTIGAGARYFRDGALMPGFLSEFSVVPSRNCLPMPSGVSPLAGALVEPLAVGVRAARMSGVTSSDAIAFLGFEDYNLGAFLQFPMCRRVVVDPHEVRRSVATSLGADETFAPTASDLATRLQEHYPGGLDAVFIAAEVFVPESQGYLALATQLVKIGGVVGFTRLHWNDAIVGLDRRYPTFRNEVRIESYGQFFGRDPLLGGSSTGELGVMMDQMARGRVSVESFRPEIVDFTDVVTGADVDDVFNRIPGATYKVAVAVASQVAP